MAKPDGKKGGKNKGNKSAAVVAKPAKPTKAPGPKPDFTPRQQKVPVVVVSDKAENIWHGYLGRVIVDDMCFEVTKRTHSKSAHEFRAVSVLVAHAGTELYGLAGLRVYVSIADLHWPNFRSPFEEGTPDYQRQERIWNFFDKLFTKMSLKGPQAQKVEEEVVT